MISRARWGPRLGDDVGTAGVWGDRGLGPPGRETLGGAEGGGRRWEGREEAWPRLP